MLLPLEMDPLFKEAKKKRKGKKAKKERKEKKTKPNKQNKQKTQSNKMPGKAPNFSRFLLILIFLPPECCSFMFFPDQPIFCIHFVSSLSFLKSLLFG